MHEATDHHARGHRCPRPPVGTVPLHWLTADERRRALLRSGSETEGVVDEGLLGRHVGRRHSVHLSLGQHRHGLDAGQGPACGPKALEAEHRPGSALDAAVVLLDGLIANDTFCLVRRTRLRLSCSRLSLRDRSTRAGAPSAEALLTGGTDAMPVDRTSDDAAGPGRPTPLGPGLPGAAGPSGPAAAGTPDGPRAGARLGRAPRPHLPR